MRIAFLLIFFFTLNPIFSAEKLSSVSMEISVKDGGNKNFRRKKHKKRSFVKVNRKQLQKRTVLKPLKPISINNRTKGGAILMAILTGPLGGHRLYLGTKPYVPIIYTLTLGGGLGLLPLIDIIVIISTSDLTRYQNNSQIIMWGD